MSNEPDITQVERDAILDVAVAAIRFTQNLFSLAWGAGLDGVSMEDMQDLATSFGIVTNVALTAEDVADAKVEDPETTVTEDTMVAGFSEPFNAIVSLLDRMVEKETDQLEAAQ